MNPHICFVLEGNFVSIICDIPSSSNHKFSRRTKEDSLLDKRSRKQREATEIVSQEKGDDMKKV